MKIYLKCQYCRHAVGQVLDLPYGRGRHVDPSEGQTWKNVTDLSSLYHLIAPHHIGPLVRGEYPNIYHLECEDLYKSWYRLAMTHKTQCHLENCPHSPAYPFRRFSLPFSSSPTTLGDPVKPPEEVKRLLRL